MTRGKRNCPCDETSHAGATLVCRGREQRRRVLGISPGTAPARGTKASGCCPLPAGGGSARPAGQSWFSL